MQDNTEIKQNQFKLQTYLCFQTDDKPTFHEISVFDAIS